jgi:lipoprotein-releasing system ATP-binding protein
MSEFVLQAVNLSKSFKEAGRELTVLNSVNFTIAKGETVAIAGASGSGKSTLLHCLGGLDILTQGQVLWGTQDIMRLSENERCAQRNRQLGFVYQFHHLLNEFTALENVAIPLLIANKSVEEARELANAMLKEVGLSGRVMHKPGELSGGERQRVALARALVTRPQCILADEPTGNLDRKTAETVVDLLLKLNEIHGTSMVVVTHDPAIVAKMGRQLYLCDGVLA